MTGDGRADEVLLLACGRGSGYTDEVLVYSDGPTLIARLAVPLWVPSAYFHPQFTRVWVSGGRLHATAEYWARDDCHFCASHLSITHHRTGHAFVVSQRSRM